MLTTKQAAAILHVNDSRVRQLIKEGKLKATRFGERVWMIDEADLDEYRHSPPPTMGRPRKDRETGA
jgi:excisionase family DNA binding protein